MVNYIGCGTAYIGDSEIEILGTWPVLIGVGTKDHGLDIPDEVDVHGVTVLVMVEIDDGTLTPHRERLHRPAILFAKVPVSPDSAYYYPQLHGDANQRQRSAQ